MTAQPWMKFYPRDWRADEKLRICSLAARGLWIEMLAIMHGSERYGHLLINGNAPTEAQLAVLAGTSANQVTELLGELEAAGVFSRSATGVIYSRRMTADERKARTARNNGKRGGNPNLCKSEDNSSSDKGLDKDADKDAVKLRSQKAEYSVDKSTGGEPPDPVKQMFDMGVALLVGSGCTEKQARSLIGKWRKAKGEAAVIQGLLDCRARAVSNPVEWLEKRFVSAKYVSESGYEYRGDLETILREAERRNDMTTYWRVKGDLRREAA